MHPTLSRRRTRIAGGGMVLAALLAGIVAWPELPASMDIHWNAAGEADSTAPRPVGVVLIPALAAAMLGLFGVLPRIDPLGDNVEEFRGYYNGFVLLLVAFLAGVQGVILAANLGVAVPIELVVMVGTGGFLIYVGILVRHAEPNWFVGIRTPWTLSSETVWERTHAVAGPIFVLAGVGLALLGVLAWAASMPGLLTGGVLAIALVAGVVPIAYSYYCYRSLGAPDDVPT